MQTLTLWFDAAGGCDDSCNVSVFVERYGNKELERQFAALEANLYGREKENWSGNILFAQMAAARDKYLRRRPLPRRNSHALGPLNP
ncbi:hypothetical protein [Solidesulfovibrio alcoholivorans]|uniref:hypothetical protein n=1 Tax=Solidesulfovibrio alcoholivorans TaxID=81406 RepID=UPI0012EC5EBD|nr:hypothetical protein [Solidesulfovibrio alcoholivorans]